MIPENIFREYDIRGLADTELTDEVMFAVGRAFGSKLRREGKKKVSLGYDLRKSSVRLFKALAGGLVASGMDVYELGLVPTPVVYFSVSHLGLDGGMCITGSHNPPEYNGLKLHLSDRPFYGKEIQELRQMIDAGDFVSEKGSLREQAILEAYKADVLSRMSAQRSLKVVVDAGHGMAGLTAPELFKKLGHDVTELYTNLDSNFPDHHPDPSVPHNLEDLQKKVLETRADLGIAFDGDADRIGVVDEKGQIIAGDQILLLYARAILERKPGAVIIGDVKCSKTIYDDIAKHGGKPIMWKTGHSLIKAKMKETHAELAGEMSGHMFFKDRWFGFDDAVYAACRMLEIAAENKRPLSTLLEDVPKTVSTPEIRVDCPDNKKFDVVRKAVESFKKNYRVVDIDGARVEFPDGWGLVRASNTQPVLVMRFEAVSAARLGEIRKIVEDQIKSSGA
ncbi:MAG: phosphomannomutase/phosphoglucomutase [Candidatus Omnitrophota bacterium]|jgi:phosphomannomutase/phosphoglucomutase